MTAKQATIPPRSRPSRIEQFVEGERKAGRPKRVAPGEKLTKTSIVMIEREVLALDEMVLTIRRKSGKILNRSDIIRAILAHTLNDQKAMQEVWSRLIEEHRTTASAT